MYFFKERHGRVETACVDRQDRKILVPFAAGYSKNYVA